MSNLFDQASNIIIVIFQARFASKFLKFYIIFDHTLISFLLIYVG